jgi:DNA repair protein RadC
MEEIKSLPLLERPREKLRFNGAQSLSDQEILAILLGSGTPKVPLHLICENLLKDFQLADIGQLDMDALCRFKGIGPAKATILLAAAEFTRRMQSGQLLNSAQDCCNYFKTLLEKQSQLQYILLLISARKELLAFCEVGSVLPEIAWVTKLATEAGAARVMLGRNGWLAFSNAERRFLEELRAACGALGMVCESLMAVGPERFKMS